MKNKQVGLPGKQFKNYPVFGATTLKVLLVVLVVTLLAIITIPIINKFM